MNDLEELDTDNFPYDSTPLHLEASGEDNDTVRLKFSGVMDVNPPIGGGESALHVACEKGDLEMVEVFLKEDFNINYVTTTSLKSPLHLAATEGHRELVRYLLNNGADVDKLNITGESALYLAGKHGHLDIVEDLLERGASLYPVEKECAEGFYPPLYMAAADGDSAFVALLLDKGAKVNQVCNNGETPLHVACGKGHYEVVKTLLSSGANINRATVVRENQLSDTALFRAASNGHSNIVKLLLDHLAEFDWPNKYGETPLYAACRNGDRETAVLLLERGARVDQDNGPDSLPWNTPLHLAVLKGHYELVKLLLEYGADVNRANKNGHSPLFAACVSHHYQVMRLLIERGAEITEIIQKTFKEDKGNVSKILENMTKLNIKE